MRNDFDFDDAIRFAVRAFACIAIAGIILLIGIGMALGEAVL